jgi:DNA-binding XRE family transcriptional regulator
LAAAECGGNRFPDAEATPAQQREWRRIIAQFVRRKAVKQHQEFTDETLAEAIGVAPRTIATLVKEVTAPGYDPHIELAKSILQGMQARTIAGPLGIRHTDESRAVFKLIHHISVNETGLDHTDWIAFGILKKTFDVDYLVWREERGPWPYTISGKPRRSRSRGTGGKRTE